MSNEIPFFYPKAKRNHKSSWCKTSATRSLLSFLCVIRSFFLSLFCHTLLRATKIHTHAHVPMVNTTKKNTKKISKMKTKKSSRAFLALFATAVFALFPRASHAWGYWGWRPYGWGWRPHYGYGGALFLLLTQIQK